MNLPPRYEPRLRAAMRAVAAVAAAVALTAPPVALAASPGLEAIAEHRTGHSPPDSVQNRFFLKTERFELSPQFGYVPNNPFARRFVGTVQLSYHFNENLSAEGTFSYSPDAGTADLKGLTGTLVQIAHTGQGSTSFEQPLDKTVLSFAAAAKWAPLYGKINLVGETVLNFDLYGVAGLGVLSRAQYAAVYWDDAPDGVVPVLLEKRGNAASLAPTIGAGMNFFLNQLIALKIDARSAFYIGPVPDYQPDEVNETDGQSRLYNNFTAGVGVSVFLPKMKPRLYDF